jgi:hypothetical protein
METETKTSNPEGIVAIFIVGALNLSGWFLGWTIAERVATLVIIGFVALVTRSR